MIYIELRMLFKFRFNLLVNTFDAVSTNVFVAIPE